MGVVSVLSSMFGTKNNSSIHTEIQDLMHTVSRSTLFFFSVRGRKWFLLTKECLCSSELDTYSISEAVSTLEYKKTLHFSLLSSLFLSWRSCCNTELLQLLQWRLNSLLSRWSVIIAQATNQGRSCPSKLWHVLAKLLINYRNLFS